MLKLAIQKNIEDLSVLPEVTRVQTFLGSCMPEDNSDIGVLENMVDKTWIQLM